MQIISINGLKKIILCMHSNDKLTDSPGTPGRPSKPSLPGKPCNSIANSKLTILTSHLPFQSIIFLSSLQTSWKKFYIRSGYVGKSCILNNNMDSYHNLLDTASNHSSDIETVGTTLLSQNIDIPIYVLHLWGQNYQLLSPACFSCIPWLSNRLKIDLSLSKRDAKVWHYDVTTTNQANLEMQQHKIIFILTTSPGMPGGPGFPGDPLSPGGPRSPLSPGGPPGPSSP